jgi:Bacteriophage tail sheath protein
MPSTLSYPGVYIEEIPSGVRTITGVATSITAFLGSALRGPVDEPVRIQSFGDFERTFGGLWTKSTLSYAAQHFFLNGGTDAIVVRIARNADKARIVLPGGTGPLTLVASSVGTWGNALRAIVDHDTADTADPNLFNLRVEETVGTTVRSAETFRNLSIDPGAARFVSKVLEQQSALVRVDGALPLAPPNPTTGVNSDKLGTDGDDLTATEYQGSESAKTGLFALEKTDLFNMLCIPPPTRDGDVDFATLDMARIYCRKRRAMLIVDSPSTWTDVATAEAGIATLGLTDKNAAIYFPRIRVPDPLRENRLEELVPCGAVAGVFARTDAQRGVWKAPAGQEATLAGVRELAVKLTDGEQGRLNPLGVNCLRTFPITGHVVWGARTLEGADRLASEWKYVPVRRLALFLEESLYRGTQWVVFEPNDEPLWSQIRLNVGAFMHNLFRQGAFQGQSPREAYLVKCDKETTTQTDINLGIVNIVVGFAPLKPAEFVILRIQQLAGQIQT